MCVLTMNEKAIDNVYMFIAELNGYKIGTVTDKLAYGKECYQRNITPALTDSTLYEVIWLERLYAEMTKLLVYGAMSGTYTGFHWSVPIELDASASMISFYGALLGDRTMLEAVNAAGDKDVLKDAWSVPGLSRKHVKTVATPRLYGSSQPVHELWGNAGLTYELQDITLMNQALSTGVYAVADALKEFIINHCNPTENMHIVSGTDAFNIQCNHYKAVGEVHKRYDLLDTASNSIRRVAHTKTKLIPDLDRFRSYFATLLVHGTDSRVADAVAGKVYDKYGFCIDIHDAFVVHPAAAEDVRQWYADEITAVYRNRKEILTNYFKSIGITGASMAAWEAVTARVTPVSDDFQCRKEVLK